MKKTTVLVTGGAGFIGSHLVDALIELGYKVVVVDNLSNGKKAHVNSKAIGITMDIGNAKVRALFAKYKPEYVFHLAANAKISDCTDRPVDTFKVNVLGTLYLLQLAREYEVKGFIYSSSSSVYGEVKVKEPINEETKTKPISIYGLEKLQAEQLVSICASVYKLPTISLRYFNVYGTSRQRPTGAYPNVFSAFIRDNKEKGKVTIYGDGKQERDFIHVYDVAQANIMAMELLRRKHPCFYGEVFNIGTGETNSVKEIARELGIEKIQYKKARKGDPRYSCADVKKAKKVLGFRSGINLIEGIDILLKSYEK